MAEGVVTLTAAARALAVGCRLSCRRCRLPPLLRRLGAELAECLPGDQMALRVEWEFSARLFFLPPKSCRFDKPRSPNAAP